MPVSSAAAGRTRLILDSCARGFCEQAQDREPEGSDVVLDAEPELAGLQEGPEKDLILDGHQLAQIRPTGQAGRQQ